MTREEAISNLKMILDEATETDEAICYVTSNDAEAINMAIKALEKQIPMKPNEYEDKFYACPVCGNVVHHKWVKYPTKLMPKLVGLPYCLNCGQRLNWMEGDSDDTQKED